jgi:hypothetical protein
MICAYCGKNGKKTSEHIISRGVLELFTECNYTYNNNLKKVYQSEPVVNDVCSDCNNKKLTYIDAYATEFVKEYFMKDYEPNCNVLVNYDYNLLSKMLIKYAFNDSRALKKNISYFDEEVKSFLLNKENTLIPKNISIYGGIAVNTSAYPSFMFGNKKLLWICNPVFLENSLIRYYDTETGQVIPRENLENWDIKGLQFSYLFKFNSGQFIIMFWTDKEMQQKYEKVISLMYPYTLIEPNKTNVILQRCTHAYNFHIPEIIDVSWGISMADATNSLVRTDINPIFIQKKLNEEWEKYEEVVRNKYFASKEERKHKKKHRHKGS